MRLRFACRRAPLIHVDALRSCLRVVHSYESQLVDGADIYLLESVREEFKRPIVAHEIIEWDIRNQTNCAIDVATAHQTAKEIDERIARETLDDKLFRTYIDWRKNCYATTTSTN